MDKTQKIVDLVKESNLPEDKKQDLLTKIENRDFSDETKDEIEALIDGAIDKVDGEIASINGELAALEDKDKDEVINEAYEAAEQKLAEINKDAEDKISDMNNSLNKEKEDAQKEIDELAANDIKSSIE